MYASSDIGVCSPKCPAGDELEMTIVDCEKSGCCLSYWKYRIIFYAVGRWSYDWELFLRDKLTPYLSETP